jgi:hypothetical protein
MAEEYVGESYGTPSEGVNHPKVGPLVTRIEMLAVNEVHNRAHIKRIRGWLVKMFRESSIQYLLSLTL